MASSRARTWRFNVFPSFHGPDIRKTFLTHLRKQFNSNGITMFDDQGIERCKTISSSLIRAIRESRISIVVLSKNYASSSWCLEELVEILDCKNIVIPIFYQVDPSDVRKQTGDFGKAFKRNCASKTKEEKQRWKQALTDVSNIAGEHLLNWNNEADMIEKIAKDVLDKLNATPSKDFDEMVGLEVHVRKLSSVLHLDCDQVMMVGICGPAVIGKTTIARALQTRLSSSFQLTCFMENVRGSLNLGLDEYGMKLHLQELLLSKILSQKGMRVCHLGAIRDRLHDRKVLIILDDVNDLEQLDGLASETLWFGPGSRIIVTTEDQELLEQHGINNIYQVDFPSTEEALKIFCRFAFKQSSPPDGLVKLAERVTELCGNLPLGLRVIGSSLRRKSKDEWEVVMHRLETSLDRNIEGVLRVGYDGLHEKEQALFLHIAVFFNYKDPHLVMAMLVDSNLDVKYGLKTLANKSLIHIPKNEKIVMHKLLQQVGRQAIQRQEPWKRQILIDPKEICNVLENDAVTGIVSGISFDMSKIGEVSLSEGAFKRMRHLQFLSVFKTGYDGIDTVHIPENMEFPPRLRLLEWKAYPRKSLSFTLNLEYLVELNMECSLLEKLWEGTLPLTNLKKMSLSCLWHLKELPDLSTATNLERLDLSACENLVELPSSFSNLHKLKKLDMMGCKRLKVFPLHINLRSLELVSMYGCSRLRRFPDISTNITKLDISYTAVEELPESITQWSRLHTLEINRCRNLKTVTHVPKSVTFLSLSKSGIEKISCDMRGVHGLDQLFLDGCQRLASLPELPDSLTYLSARKCESLESVSSCHLNTNAELSFINCFKLNEEAQRGIIQRTFCHGWACLPGSDLPTGLDQRSTGDSITIRLEGKSLFSASFGFKVFLVLSPNLDAEKHSDPALFCRRIGRNGCHTDKAPVFICCLVRRLHAEHLVMFHSDLLNKDKRLEVGNEIQFEFSNVSHAYRIIKCGVRIDTDEAGRSSGGSNEYELGQVSEDDNEFGTSKASEFSDNNGRNNRIICDSEEDNNIQGNRDTDCWSWLILCFDVSLIVRSIRSLVWGGRRE